MSAPAPEKRETFNDQYVATMPRDYTGMNLAGLYEYFDLVANNWLEAVRNIFLGDEFQMLSKKKSDNVSNASNQTKIHSCFKTFLLFTPMSSRPGAMPSESNSSSNTRFSKSFCKNHIQDQDVQMELATA